MLHIPYFQTTRIRVRAMIELAGDVRGKMVADLGAGDGRIVIAFAQAGARATGFETDPALAGIARDAIHQAGMSERATIVQKDFWQEDLSGYDIVTCYPMPDVMDALAAKLKKELHPGTRVLLNYYEFTDWNPVTSKEHIYLYSK